MPFAAEHADALRWYVLDYECGPDKYYEEIPPLGLIRTLPGVKPLMGAGRNGPGPATIRSGPNGTELSFRAPGSQSWGVDVDCAADGTYLLEDGEDTGKWLRIQVYADYLPNGPAEASIRMHDRYGAGVGYLELLDISVTVGAGDQTTPTYYLYNASRETISDVCVWLDPAAVDFLEIDEGGPSWVKPIAEADAVELGDVAPGEMLTVSLRQTVAAGTPADPDVLNHLHSSYNAL